MSDALKKLFDNNQRWVDDMIKSDPDFFKRNAESQSPEYLWIGCSDSRVAASVITGMQPGVMFVHRNIANLVVHTDTNVLSVIYYAATVLKVKHIVVCGHYGCGGVKAALSNESHGFMDNWLDHIKDTADKYKDELSKLNDSLAIENRLVELNVLEQVNNIAKISFIQDCWQDGEFPYIHGLVYDLQHGKLKNLQVTLTG